jgi:ABC-type Zn uptake system ZnuABC Zn-binding protein ZnuA
MRALKGLLLLVSAAALALMFASAAGGDAGKGREDGGPRIVVTSDSILSGMAASLLPSGKYVVDVILPPGQCPGHYDVKLSDMEKVEKAALVVSFRGMSFVDRAGLPAGALLLVDGGGRNWMVPEVYLRGLALLAGELSKRFPDDAGAIAARQARAAAEVRATADALAGRIRQAGIRGLPVLASSMQREPLEWMGLGVAGVYGRPETMSAREVVRLSRAGREARVVLVVDNLQSGPDAGKGIAETLGARHAVLSNFPSERGYLATLEENVEAVLAAVRR